MIHVCFGLHDKTGHYSKFTGTAIVSMFENNPPPTPSITVHILHDNTLTPENRDKFSYVAGRYGQLVKFYNVEKLCADRFDKIKKLFPQANQTIYSIAMFYRFMIPYILPDESKAVYLDSDIIVNMDIAELWKVELNNNLLAAVTEVSNDVVPKNVPLCADGLVGGKDYFNSGVLVMNLPGFREEWDSIMQGIMFIANNRKYRYADQDILNYCFSTRTVKLPGKFNRSVRHERNIKDLSLAGKIHHFYSCALSLEFSDPFNRLWMKYFSQTPWFNSEIIARLYTGVKQQLNSGFKQSMINLTALMSGKTRGFFVAPANVDVLKKIFSIRDDEEVITADSQESLNKLLDAMKRARGKKIFFILLPNFPLQILTQAGFAQGKDFVNGLDFLSEAQGVPFNSYPLVQAM